jgi:DNA adenine methylase
VYATADAPATLIIKPPLKWAGGKRWLVPHLLPFWERHQHRRYVEPFVGGLAAPLGLLPSRALLNDNNFHLISFYRWVQQGHRVSIDMRNDRALYYQHRERFNQYARAGIGDGEAAELFYYLNRTGYNGLCRFNKRGEFNVPFGSYKTINYLTDFAPYRPILGAWEFTDMDFETLPLEKGDFIYADPPYDVDFVQYSRHGFSWDDQVRLAEWLSQHPGPVVLSNQATDRIEHLYRKLGFDLRFLSAPRRISCNGDRRPAVEVLATRRV